MLITADQPLGNCYIVVKTRTRPTVVRTAGWLSYEGAEPHPAVNMTEVDAILKMTLDVDYTREFATSLHNDPDGITPQAPANDEVTKVCKDVLPVHEVLVVSSAPD